MKNLIKLIYSILFFSLLVSCELDNQVNPRLTEEIPPQISVSKLLQNASDFQNLPTVIIKYQGSTEISRKDKYYNTQAKDLFDVYFGKSEIDTLSIVIYSYQNDLLSETNSYAFDGEKYVFDNKFNYKYDSEDRLVQIDRGNTVYKKYEYNAANQIDKILFGPNLNLAEGYRFYYDIQGRIFRQIWTTFSPESSPFRDWNYIYDEEGKLLSKSVPTYPDNKLVPMFEYGYDDLGRLTQEVEFYPEYGFVEIFKTLYQYSK